MIKKYIIYCLLGLIYIITYVFKIDKDKVTFISYKTDELQGDFKLISKYLEKKEEYKLNYILIKYENTISGNILYMFNCIKQVYYINTSTVIILDYNNYVVSHFKKKAVKVIQVWHASGAIKKFGNDVKRDYKIKNYDYVLCTSEEWKKPYSTAFNISESNVIVTGIPKVDVIFSKKRMNEYRENILEIYPSIKGKKVILFAPTFRGDPIKEIKYEKIDLDHIKENLGDEYVLIYKLHPWFGDKIIANSKEIINANKQGLRKLFSVTDYLITDYSSLVFDFSIMHKPIIFFAPDLELYKNDRGMYIDYEKSVPGAICKNEKEVITAIIENDFDVDKVQKFKDKYFKYKDSKSTERVGNFIIELIDNTKITTKKSNFRSRSSELFEVVASPRSVGQADQLG